MVIIQSTFKAFAIRQHSLIDRTFKKLNKMATDYKTPGVYIKETNQLSGSISTAKTALPVFIGYTQKAKCDNKDLHMVLTPISSMMEYRKCFGIGKNAVIHIEDNQFRYNKSKVFPMYNSIRMFFENGGGDCFVLSVGKYGTKKVEDFKKGLEKLVEYITPTLVLVPGAVFFEDKKDCDKIQRAVMIHCGEIMRNRFAILDIYDGDKDSYQQYIIDSFREVMTTCLSYGAAYYPWLNTILYKKSNVNYSLLPNDISYVKKLAGYPLHFNTLPVIEDRITAQDKLFEDLNKKFISGLFSRKKALFAIGKINPGYPFLEEKKIGKASITFKDLLLHLFKSNIFNPIIVDILNNMIPAVQLADGTVLRDDKINLRNLKKIRKKIPNTEINDNQRVLNEFNISEVEKSVTKLLRAYDENSGRVKAVVGTLNPPAIVNIYTNPTILHSSNIDVNLLRQISEIDAQRALYALGKAASSTPKYPIPYDPSAQVLLLDVNPSYKEAFADIYQRVNQLPPSPMIAGIYNYSDEAVNVGRAPANYPLNSVISPTCIVTHQNQTNLNIPLDGKAVNAIRFFRNRGVLVWGARTLNGNDANWRYINVRRSVIMIESFIQQLLETYVFKSNTLATWIDLETQITSFLIKQWDQGILVGTSSEEAFEVAIGLGSTMTAQDIIDGIMRISVKLAVTRPAEFIEVTFEQVLNQP